jgi:signal transduction histidine kinase
MSEKCSIKSIINDCLLLIQNLTLERIKIIDTTDDKGLFVTGNSSKLYQIFLNILLNAVESIKNEGKIEIYSKIQNNCISVSFSDTGKGIPAKNLKLITEPFYTTKEAGKGTGLGLYITLSLIKEHNGLLEFISTPGKGTTVTVILPIIS